MKDKNKENSKKSATNSVNTPSPPQVIDPSKPPVIQDKKGDTHKSKGGDQDKLAPKEEL